MTLSERKAQVNSYLGKTVDIKIDRPIGYVHKKEKYTLNYPINYGYIPNVLGGDGEELDVYLMGVPQPVSQYRARIIGIVHRYNDIEDKLVAAPENAVFYQNEIAEAVSFQEKYYKTRIQALFEKSAGAVLYSNLNGEINYLLIKQSNGDIGFPKGHVEMGETDIEAALREIYEETSVKTRIKFDFRQETNYVMPNGIRKTVVYFLADFKDQIPCHNEGFEDNEYMILPFSKALNAITFDNAKEILRAADIFLNSNTVKLKFSRRCKK